MDNERRYLKGLHIISTLKTQNLSLLQHSSELTAIIRLEIERQELHSLGEVVHDFKEGGYTFVICLVESHISIHTWPEFGLCTFDIFLSNFMNDNSEKGKHIFKIVKDYLQAEPENYTELLR